MPYPPYPTTLDEAIDAWLLKPDLVAEIFGAFPELKTLLAQVRAHMPSSATTGREDIPTPDELRAMLEHATGQSKPLLMTEMFTGLRASELRDLTWDDIDLDRGTLTVRQRRRQKHTRRKH